MPCEASPRECLAWHILPKLDAPKPNAEGTSIRSLCPAHDDGNQSFGISIGDNKRPVWHCFAGCSGARIRVVLIARGVPSSCLPMVAKEREDLLAVLRSIIFDGSSDHAVIRLRAAAAFEGYDSLPKGGELERIAGLAGVNRATAYKARKAERLPSTHNPVLYPDPKTPVKPRRSEGSRKVD